MLPNLARLKLALSHNKFIFDRDSVIDLSRQVSADKVPIEEAIKAIEEAQKIIDNFSSKL